MPPVARAIPSHVAEPSQEPVPYGRWEAVLAERFRAACAALKPEDGEQVGEPGAMNWFPDRTWGGRTYVPCTSTSSAGYELFGFVSYTRADEESEPGDFEAHADYTDETAEANPDWTLDLSDHELGPWRGPENRRGNVALVWGVSLVPNGAIATAELGPVTTDQCILRDDRFTLVSLDDYTGDLLEVHLYDRRGTELAAESLYAEE